MDEATLTRLLNDVRAGEVSADEAVSRLRRLPFADLDFAKVDHHRLLRQGAAEAVYGPGKTPGQCAAIVAELLTMAGAGPILLTRAGDEQAAAALALCPGGVRTGTTVVWRPAPERDGNVLVITAGTSDGPAAEECLTTLRANGFRPHLLADCGVAGVHRLLSAADDIARADVIVTIAGMEGALASVVGGLAACPVVALPTSAGYGSAFEGITALLAMLASCAAGIAVVGIDNGFGAACVVARILR
ncbi:MAG: nickel pincer cofactor biosynthesis protein LarB [Acidimicrobiales bacterium]